MLLLGSATAWLQTEQLLGPTAQASECVPSHVQLSVIPWSVACQAPLFMGFFRQEYCSGLPFPSPGESSWPRNWTRVSCIAGRLFTDWAMREDQKLKVTKWATNYHSFFLNLCVSYFKVDWRCAIIRWNSQHMLSHYPMSYILWRDGLSSFCQDFTDKSKNLRVISIGIIMPSNIALSSTF